MENCAKTIWISNKQPNNNGGYMKRVRNNSKVAMLIAMFAITFTFTACGDDSSDDTSPAISSSGGGISSGGGGSSSSDGSKSPCGSFSDCGDGGGSSGSGDGSSSSGDKKGQVYKKDISSGDWQEYTGNADIKINVYENDVRSELDAGKIEGGIVKLNLPEIAAKYLWAMDEEWEQSSSCNFTSGAKVYFTSDEGFNYYTETTNGFTLRLINDFTDEAYEMVRYIYSLGAVTMNCTTNIDIGAEGSFNNIYDLSLSQGWNEVYVAWSISEKDGKTIRSRKMSTNINTLTHLNDIKWRM
jgi:hypothetical protein